MVMLLLNLAIIPDDVVKKMDFNPGWSRRFLHLMQDYRKNWDDDDAHKAPTGHKFKFQDNELETAYQKFVIQQYETDIQLHEDTIKFQNKLIDINKKKLNKTAYQEDFVPDFDEKSLDSDFYEGGKDNYYYRMD